MPEVVASLFAPREALTPRIAETLELLLEGGSEKEMALQLGVSRHTVHVYVKALYRHFDVCSRAELMALFVKVLLKSLRRRSVFDAGEARVHHTLTPHANRMLRQLEDRELARK